MCRLTKILPALLLLSCALFYPPAEARADGIEITSGVWAASNPTLIAGRWRSNGYGLSGNGLYMSGGEGDGSVNVVGCSPCEEGDSFYLAHPGSLFARMPLQYLQFNGQTFEGWNYGLLNFNSDLFVIPSSGGTLLTLTGHFTMTGTIMFEPYNVDNPADLRPFVVGDVYGSGIVTVQFTRISGAYHMSSVRYQFQPTQPTPEPVTLVMLGSGLAGLAARHRGRRSRLGKPL